MFATYARRGLPPRGLREPHVHPHFNSRMYRAKLVVMLVGIVPFPVPPCTVTGVCVI